MNGVRYRPEGKAGLPVYSELGVRDHLFLIYPLATGPQADAKCVAFSQQHLRTTHFRDFRFFEELAEVMQYEPSGAFTPYELGLLKSLGIEKGKIYGG